MDENIPEEQQSIFEELRKFRTSKGINLEEIATHTKINMAYLEALESGQPAGIPAIYDTLFLKTYLAYMGIEDHQKYIDAFKQLRKNVGPHQSTIMRKTRIEQLDRRKTGIIKLLYIGLPLLIVATIVIVLAINSTTTSSDTDTQIKELSVQQVVQNMQPAEQVEAEPQSSDSLILDAELLKMRLEVIQRSWIRVVKDHRDTSEFLLKKNENLNLQADSVLQFIVGNAAGIRFFVNSKDLGVLGKSGQVFTDLKITNAGIVEKRVKLIKRGQANADSLGNN